MNIYDILQKILTYDCVQNELNELKSTKHSDDSLNIYHIENDVYTHTFMVLNYLKLKYGSDNIDPQLVISALFHDIGKKESFKYINGKKYFINHWVVSGNIFRNLCLKTNYFDNIINKKQMINIYKLIQLHHIKTNNVSKFIKDNFNNDISLYCLKILDELNEADVMGRISIKDIEKERTKITNLFHDRNFKLNKYDEFNIDSFKDYISKNIDISNETYFIIMPIGAPNSGKTTLFNLIKENIDIEMYRKGFDDIRLELSGIKKSIFEISDEEYSYAFKNSDNSKLLPSLLKYFNSKIESKKSKLFFIDNTNCTLKGRLNIIKELKRRFNKRNINVKFIGIFFNIDLDTLYYRNDNRNYKVPKEIIRRMYVNTNYPMNSEFDKIFYSYPH